MGNIIGCTSWECHRPYLKSQFEGGVRWTRSTSSTKRLGFMPKHTLTGTIRRHRRFPSKILGNRRDVLVWLPQGYSRFSRKRHPVLYLQDGQNVFDAATAFAWVEWGVDETAQGLIRRKLIEPIIIVAIANTGPDPIHEYVPTPRILDRKARRQKRSRGLARK